jgi:hypothetical protein
MLEKEDLISYADDSYLIKSNKSKEIALRRLQFQIQNVEKWLTSSGLKVNVEKTEIVIFHKMDTSTSSIKINEVKIPTKKQITVLGVIFDSKLEWSLQVENSVRKARSALQGLRVINKYFTFTERLTLITSFFTLASTMDHKFGSYHLSKASLRQNCFQLLGQHLNYWTGTGHSKTFTKNITEQHLLNSRNTQLPFLYMT